MHASLILRSICVIFYTFIALIITRHCHSLFILLQFCLVWAQNRKKGKKKVFLETIPVIVGLKPAVDAYRVVNCAKIEEFQLVDPIMEMTIIKVIEMFAESIPGVIIQLSSILSDGKLSKPVVASLAISALTTGFISGTISYDFDTDPLRRVENPDFYGYIPDDSRRRFIIFLSSILLSAVMLLVRAMTLVLISLISTTSAILFITAEVVFYLLYKIFLGDLFYWIPFEGALEYVIAVVARTVSKVIMDFTCNAQLRHPNECGGSYWLFNFGLSLLSLPLITMYYQSADGKQVATEIAFTACYIFLPSCLVLIFMFFMNIEPGYRKTFYGLMRGKDLIVSHFRSPEDAVKAKVFRRNRRLWKSIEKKVELWVRENWKKWMEEEPEWLTENMKSMIPPHMIPDDDSEGNAKAQNSARSASARQGRGKRASLSLRTGKILPQEVK